MHYLTFNNRQVAILQASHFDKVAAATGVII